LGYLIYTKEQLSLMPGCSFFVDYVIFIRFFKKLILLFSKNFLFLLNRKNDTIFYNSVRETEENVILK